MTKMTIHTTLDIHAPAADAWQLFGEGFGDWADWAPGIDASTLEGPLAEGVVRLNTTAALGTMRQTLVRFDRSARALTYEVAEGLPPFLERMRNDWVIEANGEGRCRLVGDAIFVLTEQAAPMRPKLEGKMARSLETFAVAVRDQLEGSAPA